MSHVRWRTRPARSDARSADSGGASRASSACRAAERAYSDEATVARPTAMRTLTPSDYDRAMVGISLLTLVPGELGGSETYVRELLRALERTGELEYRVLLPPAAPAAAEGLPAELATEYRRAQTIPERLLAMGAAAVRPDPLRARLRDADVVHYPLTLRIPSVRQPSVVTLHDVQHLDLPGMFPRTERLFRRLAWHRSVRSADRVIVMSEFVRGRAVELLGLDPARIRVVPLGLDHDRLVPLAAATEPFLLYPARPWPHKNHGRLFEAFALLRRKRPELRLVLTGGAFDRVPDGVEARGHVPWAEVVTLMQHASALVFPSLYEGFGLPPLEAMACGCPVACSDAAALPEVVGDAARLFDPRDPRAIADAVLDVLADREAWVERGLAHAKRFSWEQTAHATEATYRELL
jgi:glycosyltransferase involved in cell wall biosynthesis